MDEFYIALKALVSLGLVFTIMYVFCKLLQKYTDVGIKGKKSRNSHLSKIEHVIYVDNNHKIIDMSNNAGEHYIIFIGKNNSFLLDKIAHNSNGLE